MVAQCVENSQALGFHCPESVNVLRMINMANDYNLNVYVVELVEQKSGKVVNSQRLAASCPDKAVEFYTRSVDSIDSQFDWDYYMIIVYTNVDWRFNDGHKRSQDGTRLRRD